MNRAKPENRLARVLQAEAARNGHALPGVQANALAQNLAGPQVIRFAPSASASLILDMILPGRPMPIPVGAGLAPIMGAMVNWTETADKMREMLPADSSTWTREQTHEWNLVNTCAAFQRSAMALAEAAAGIRAAAAPAQDEKLPEAPSESDARPPLGLDDGGGRDANGSPSE